jgi:signal transduction histidine kinase/ligand-binding sensor domain-containing protein
LKKFISTSFFMRKNLLHSLAPIIPVAIWIGVVLASCNRITTNDDQPKQTAFKQPVTVPLTFSKPRTIDWAAIKDVKIKPVVKKIDLDKLPAEPYVSNGLKSVAYDTDEVKFDYNSLPQKDFDIDQLPSKPLKFKTIKLPPPKLIKSGPPRLKDTTLSLYELDAPDFHGRLISCLLEDHDGFLWISTRNGIYRYDGENLVLYLALYYNGPDAYHYPIAMWQDQRGRIWISEQNEGIEILDPVAGTLKKTNSSLGLGSNHPYRIMQDAQQRIWISCNWAAGVNIIDPKTETVKWLNKEHGLSDTAQIDEILQDKQNNIWIGSWKGINVIDLKNKTIKYLGKASGLKSDTVNEELLDSKGNLWAGFRGGIISIINIKNGTIQSTKKTQLPRKDCYSLTEDSKGRIWASPTNNGLQIMDAERQTAKYLNRAKGLAGDYIANIMQDSRGQVWIATDGGLNMIRNKEAIVEHIGDVPTTALAEDSKGMVWQATLYNGINIIDRKTQTIRRFDTSNGLSNDTMSFVKEINSRFFIGTSTGLDIIDSARKTITHLGKKEGFRNRSLTTAVVDKQGAIWIGGDNGMDVYNAKSYTYKHLSWRQGLSDTSVEDMIIDRQGKIWVSSFPGGVAEADPGTGIIQNINNAPLKGKDQRILLPDDACNMWIGTVKGLYFADFKNRTLTSFSTAQGLPDEAVLSVQKHGDKILVGTAKGISVITPPKDSINGDKNWKIETFDKLYGLNKVEVGYETDLVTRDGLYWWGDKGITVLGLDKKDHYIPPAYITIINVMDQPKLFGGRERTTSNGLTWDNATDPFNMPDNLHLPYNQNYLRFNYGSLNLTAHDTVWYRYILAGVDKSWSSESNANVSRNYFSMPPGEYTFKVVTKSSDAGWSKPALLTFTINPPWWQTWWAYVIYVVLLGGSIWGFSHYRSLQLIKDKRALEHKVHERTEQVMQQKEEIETQRDDLEKAFNELKTTQNQLIQAEKMASLGELTAGIAHEIQNPLNFVNNFSEVSKELMGELGEELDKGDTKEAKVISLDVIQNLEKIVHHGKRADAIVKGMLQHSQSGSGIKEPVNINTLADEYLRLSYHGSRSKDKSFNAEMVTHFDEKLPKINVIPQDIGRVMLNLFNNAFYSVNQKQKTAGADYKPEVTVTTATENRQVIIKVKDNGIGIPDAIKDKIMQPFFTTKPTGEGTGLGLSLTYDMIVKGHGGSIALNSVEGEFTEFIIQLPIS